MRDVLVGVAAFVLGAAVARLEGRLRARCEYIEAHGPHVVWRCSRRRGHQAHHHMGRIDAE